MEKKLSIHKCAGNMISALWKTIFHHHHHHHHEIRYNINNHYSWVPEKVFQYNQKKNHNNVEKLI
ncbi:hypothetical protein DERF_002304 [Dermatophagoides farinae]|uniref:Uncharacterized protein n=1 Tax=Dermatophagoides farinae TaxID=6954 RepID=A0A922IDH2_DERFA|nr:hypothetical protein DERF_002304 [Dermatophagoides farinae]